MKKIIRHSLTIFIALIIILNLKTDVKAEFDPAKAKLLDSKKIQLFERENKPAAAVALEKVQIEFKQPPSVGFRSDFSLKFIGTNGAVIEKYILNSDLIFDIKEQSDFSITTKGKTFSGKGRIEIPFRDADYKNGTFSASVVFNKVYKGLKLSIYLKKTTENDSKLICESDLNIGYGNIAGILFYLKDANNTAGNEFEINVSIYNHRGELITDKPEEPVLIKLQTGNKFVINGKEVNDQFLMEPASFVDGKSALKIKCERAGSYQLSSAGLKTFNQIGTGKWNTIGFNVIPAIAEKTEIKTASAASAGDEFPVEWELFDRFGNKIDAQNLEADITPFTAGSIQVNKEKVQNSKIKFLKGKNIIAITKSGSYKLASVKGETVIEIKPSVPERVEFQIPEEIKAGESSRISILLYDRFGNPANFKEPLKLYADAEILPDKQIDVSLAEKTIFELPLLIKKTGRYKIKLSGFGEQVDKEISVLPSDIKLLIDEKNIKRTSGDRIITIPVTVTDDFGNISESPAEYHLTAGYSKGGQLGISGSGITTQKKSVSGDRVTVPFKIKIKKGLAKTQIVLTPGRIEFVELVSQSQKVLIPVKRTSSALTYERVQKSEKNDGAVEIKLFSNPVEEKMQISLLEKYLKENDSAPELTIVWDDESKTSKIKNELTYYRNFRRLDYQKWDVSGKKRVKRILIRKISEEEISKAKIEGADKFPGVREAY